LQVSPQTDPTSLTQIESHCVEQQYGSTPQMLVAQGSHDFFSCEPVEQIPWLHPVPPPELLPEPPPELLPPPGLHDSPQMVPTSLTHCESHFVVQQ
jgi:hypothetical protein